MSLLGICCALGISEQLGLKWQHLNLTESAILLDGEPIEKMSLAVREHSYHGHVGSVKHGHRRRNLPLPTILIEALTELRKHSKWTGAEDPIFAGESGKPIWADNLAKRVLKPLAKDLQMPWVSFHVFRHTCATLTNSARMMDVDRRVVMGHADSNMTDHYTHEDFERMRGSIETIAQEITRPPKRDGEPDEPQQPKKDNVIEFRRVG